MAENDARNVSTGKPKSGGAIFTAPFGTELPTDATSELTSEYENVGYAADSGLSNEVTSETNSFKAWGGVEVATAQGSSKEEFKYSMIETNAVVLKQVYGDANVTVDEVTGAIAVRHNALEREARVYVFDIVLAGNRAKRIVVPNGKITAIDAISYTDGDLIKYGVTLSALPGSDGDTSKEYNSPPPAEVTPEEPAEVTPGNQSTQG